MSGHLVVLDRSGREGKKFLLESGIATIGRGASCDIRVTCPTVSPHHATIVIHNNQAILRSAGGNTQVNGRGVSVWRLRHGDALAVGGRHLRWHAADTRAPQRGSDPQPALVQKRGRGNKNNRRVTTGANSPNRIKLEIEALHRASMPASAGKQVAIVQPQRRDTSDQNGGASPRAHEERRRASLAAATKATLWIESRKLSPRKSTPRQTTPLSTRVRKPAASAKKTTPLRLTVLRKAQSAHKPVVLKIQDPARIDHTKQAALMLMAGHTPKLKPSPKSVKNSPSYVIKKPSPVRKTPTAQGRKSTRGSTNGRASATPNSSYGSAQVTRSSRRGTGNQSVLEISDSEVQSSLRESVTSRYTSNSSLKSPQLQSPRKSALKDPSVKSNKKNESIKFDLSNLENYNESEDILLVSNSSTKQINDSLADSTMTLRFSDASNAKSPSPRRPLSSRSSKIMEKTLGSPLNYTKERTIERSTLTPGSPNTRKSARGSLIVQKALTSSHNSTRGSKTRTLIDESGDNNSAFRTKTLSPRKSNLSRNMESYSIVDLVSMDSNETGRASSVYNSADSINSSVVKFGTPRNSSGRKSKSTIRGSLLSSSTPYVPKVNRATRSTSSPNISTVKSVNLTKNLSGVTRRSKSLTTPENTNQSINDTRISRTSRCRSRINDSDLLLLSTNVEDTEDTSPKSSRRISKTDKSNTTIQSKRKTRSINATITLDDSTLNNGLSTPENRHSPVEEVRTPKLNIRSLLDSSLGSNKSSKSPKKGLRNSKRKTIATISRSSINRGRHSAASRSLVAAAKKSLRLSPNTSPLPDNEIVTPKSAVKIIQEAVKNKHSTAKKPQSKRSIIDNLNESDIVKQLFNSPVKRKLSQSMTEFSRKQLFDDEIPKKATRHTIALGGTPDHSILNNSDDYTPDAFVSPLSTPGTSPRSAKRLSNKKSLENSGAKTSRALHTRNSVKNDLTNISGVKNVFAKSPRNRLSDIRGVKKMFAPSPENDLRRVSGVKTLFRKQRSPKNDLTDVRGVKSLFKRASPRSDYRNVSGVKKTFAKLPKNDLSDVRGIKNMFGRKKRQTDYNNVSGVEDLFNVSYNSNKDSSADRLFDQLVGKPNIKSVYSKSYAKTSTGASKRRAAKSLHDSIDVISNNVEDWLEQELQKRLQKVNQPSTSQRKSRELAILATDTVAGSEPVTTSRVRNSTLTKSTITNVSDRKKSASEVYSAHTLPIKKRSIIEASLHKSQNNSQNKSANKSAARHQLPIKKRVVVHSTPVKGRYNMTMNASELGRVSPIIGDKAKDVHETSFTTLPEAKSSPQPKGRRGTRAQQTVDDIPEVINEPAVNITPKKSRGRQSKASQSRIVKKSESVVANVKKRRSSIVITKKSPKANPKNKNSLEPASPKVQLVKPTPQPVSPKLQPASPKRTRGKPKSEVQETVKTPKRTTRAKVQEPVKSPKRATRTKVQKATVVVTKPSPKLKPRGKSSEVDSDENKTYSKRSRKNVSKELPETKGKQKKVVSPQPAELPTRRTRKTVEVKVQSPPKRSKAAEKNQKSEPVESKRGKKAAVPEPTPPKGKKKTSPVVEVVENRRGRRNVEPVEPQPLPKRGKQTAEIIEEPKTRRGKTNTEVEPPANKRARKTEPVALPEPTTKRGLKTEPKTETNKKTTKKSASPIKQTKAKGKKVESQASTQSEPTTRGRRNNQKEITVVETKRSRKTNLDDAKPTKILQKSKSEEVVKKTRGRKTTVVEESKAVVKQDKGKKSSAVVKESPVKARATRGRQPAAVVEEKPVRGSRKRKSDTSPAKENKSHPAKKSRIAEVPPASKRSTRTTNQTEAVPKTGGRQRRR